MEEEGGLALSRRFAEQPVRRAAVVGGGIPMRRDAGDFGFEQDDAQGQLVLRIGCQIFGCQRGGGILGAAGFVRVVHCGKAFRKAGRLLSIVFAASEQCNSAANAVRGK